MPVWGVEQSTGPRKAKLPLAAAADIRQSLANVSDQPQATFDFLGAAKRTHVDCHEAAVAYSDRCWPERWLYEVLRS